MRLSGPVVVFVLALPFVISCGNSKQLDRASLVKGLGNLHHPISTKSSEAQEFFDQGMAFIYGFNFREALRSFETASDLDPKAAMPYWGVALALGPNYNTAIVSPDNERRALDALSRGMHLARDGPEEELAYCHTLSKRFSSNSDAKQKELDRDYASAMRELSRRNLDDPDAATLYAESLMDLHRYSLWNATGQPSEDTAEITLTLESALRRWPNHIGANHFYIHLMEVSPEPDRALESAHKLEDLAPGAAHLLHMPAHVYIHTGDYKEALKTTLAAQAVDREYLENLSEADPAYVSSFAEHNSLFVIAIADIEGDFGTAFQSANELATVARTAPSDWPSQERYTVSPILVLSRFARWDDVLASPPPQDGLSEVAFFWHYARACAFAVKRQSRMVDSERAAFEQAYSQLSADGGPMMSLRDLRSIHDIAALTISARAKTARGNFSGAIDDWRNAVIVQDHMHYQEPPVWYPVRESLGAALLRNGRAHDAEKVFREDLSRNLHNPRSLFGLSKSLAAQHLDSEASEMMRQFEAYWKGKDFRLDIGEF